MDAYADRREATSLTHRQTLLIVLGVLLPTFMGSLDQTILATALPTIGRDFGDVHNLPWLITAYLLASTAVIPLYGKIADIHGRRFTLRIAILTYMAGSLVCALAPNMLVLILGRVLHGLGGGGLSSMGMVVLADLVAPKERGRYYGCFRRDLHHGRRQRPVARRVDRRPFALVGHLLDQHSDGACGVGDHDIAAAPPSALRAAASP
jgi:hypothetical protein